MQALHTLEDDTIIMISVISLGSDPDRFTLSIQIQASGIPTMQVFKFKWAIQATHNTVISENAPFA